LIGTNRKLSTNKSVIQARKFIFHVKRSERLLLLPLIMAGALWVGTNVLPAHATNTFQNCDLFANLVSPSTPGQMAWWRPDQCGIPHSMTLIGTLNAPGITCTAGAADCGGGIAFNVPSCALGPGHPCLYATEFSGQTVVTFDNTGAYLGTCGAGYNLDPESIVVDTRNSPGAIYVGQADGTHQILKFNLDCSPGTPSSFSPAIENRGSDWIDLVAPDSSDRAAFCDIQYTSEGTHVGTFDVCANIQEASLNSVGLPGITAYAHRQLTTDESVLVADTSVVAHLDSSGNLINTCDSSTGTLFALNILPNSTQFVTADDNSAKTDYFTIAHCDAGNTSPDFSFNAIPAGCTSFCGISGLAVFSEVTPPGSSGVMFVSSTGGGTITRINLDTLASKVILTGLQSPEGGVYGPDGLLYFALSGEHGGTRAIVRFNPDGTSLTTVMNMSNVPALVGSGGPEGPRFDSSGNLYFNTRVTPGSGFVGTGVWQIPGGTPGATPVQVISPYTSYGEDLIFLNSGPFAGNLLAADFANNRMIRVAPPFVSAQTAINFTTTTSPNGLAFNATGTLFVSESNTGLIKRFAPNGTFLGIFASVGSGSGPRKIGFDSAGNLYVANAYTNQVVRLDPSGTQTVIATVADANSIVMAPQIVASFDFSLTNSGNIAVSQGGSMSNTVTARLYTGASESITLSLSGLPSGGSSFFSGGCAGSPSCTAFPTFSSTLTISTLTSVPTGSYAITVTGLGGGVTHTTQFTLVVSSAGGVGGVVAPIDKLALLAPYIGLAAVLGSLVVAATYLRRTGRTGRKDNLE
jgi:streptogramin lyase